MTLSICSPSHHQILPTELLQDSGTHTILDARILKVLYQFSLIMQRIHPRLLPSPQDIGGTTGGSDMEQHHGELVLPVGSLKNSKVALDKQK
jgi:hypothetical protein